ncbi:hypothetical protein ACEV85_23175 [Vibrio parahaemolyticus]|uniref:hypothetical protein n=1 Tax=Vibrio parahaemolyticus TaxID=670 RepID=UPI0011234DE1|nr:hypothetical protein [Vibrio parahaemolyticus]EIV1709763.1 hypothetical protein [Vibrio parahaemolyticus]
MNDIFSEIAELEPILGVPNGFYDRLRVEDDWSFVIKLSALFEAVGTQALASKLQHVELEDAFAQLEQAHPKYGKIALMFKLSMITVDQRKFLLKLAELRNKLVHNISEVSFEFEGFISSLDNNQKSSFADTFGFGIHETFEIQGHSCNRKDFTIENPKWVIWVTASEILACLSAEIKHGEDVKKLHELGMRLLENITKHSSVIPNA